jgi:hypothetical protein
MNNKTIKIKKKKRKLPHIRVHFDFSLVGSSLLRTGAGPSFKTMASINSFTKCKCILLT